MSKDSQEDAVLARMALDKLKPLTERRRQIIRRIGTINSEYTIILSELSRLKKEQERIDSDISLHSELLVNWISKEMDEPK